MMAMIGLALMVVGMVIAFVGGIWLLIVTFQESVLWGLGTLFVPFVGLIFVVLHWDKAGRPFLVNLGGAVVMIVGVVLGGGASSDPRGKFSDTAMTIGQLEAPALPVTPAR